MHIIIDAHCDTISKLLEKECDLTNNELCVNLQNIKNMKGYVQFFATFLDTRKVKINPLVYTLKIIDKFYEQVEKFSEYIDVALKYEDIVRVTNKEKCAAVLWVEGGEALCGELSTLRILYKLGVRGMTLTWNYKNELACGVEEDIDTGLSEFGINVIKEMNRLGMIIDISHLGELGFWKVVNYSRKPIIASHSNAKRICNHIRNLTDEQIKAIAKLEGVIGICYCPDFLNQKKEATIDDVINHIEHIAMLVGTRHVGLGSDFDGIDAVPRGVENLSRISNILNELARRNYTEEQINEIAGGNFLRVIKDVME